MNPKPAPRKERASFMFARETKGSVLLIIFRIPPPWNQGVGSSDHIQENRPRDSTKLVALKQEIAKEKATR